MELKQNLIDGFEKTFKMRVFPEELKLTKDGVSFQKILTKNSAFSEREKEIILQWVKKNYGLVVVYGYLLRIIYGFVSPPSFPYILNFWIREGSLLATFLSGKPSDVRVRDELIEMLNREKTGFKYFHDEKATGHIYRGKGTEKELVITIIGKNLEVDAQFGFPRFILGKLFEIMTVCDKDGIYLLSPDCERKLMPQPYRPL